MYKSIDYEKEKVMISSYDFNYADFIFSQEKVLFTLESHLAILRRLEEEFSSPSVIDYEKDLIQVSRSDTRMEVLQEKLDEYRKFVKEEQSYYKKLEDYFYKSLLKLNNLDEVAHIIFLVFHNIEKPSYKGPLTLDSFYEMSKLEGNL